MEAIDPPKAAVHVAVTVAVASKTNAVDAVVEQWEGSAPDNLLVVSPSTTLTVTTV